MLGISLVNSVLVALCVVIHYEFLYQMTRLMPRLNIKHRSRIVVGVIGALLAHTIEIWIFAAAYYWLHHAEGFGSLSGNYDGSYMSSVYYSFTSYTTLGFGDIVPSDSIRFVTGIEALVGLVLITWTASFLYLEMTRNWDSE